MVCYELREALKGWWKGVYQDLEAWISSSKSARSNAGASSTCKGFSTVEESQKGCSASSEDNVVSHSCATEWRRTVLV